MFTSWLIHFASGGWGYFIELRDGTFIYDLIRFD